MGENFLVVIPGYKRRKQLTSVEYASVELKELDMAQNLPFSIANILRTDFPDPSRVSKLPPIVQEQPQKETWESVFETRNQPLRGLPLRCDEVGPLDGNGACSTHVDALESCIEFLQPDFVGIEEEQQSLLNVELKGN